MRVTSPEDLANYYRDYRTDHDLSQGDVGERVAMRQGTVSDFESKPNKAYLETLFRLLSAMDLEMHIVPKDQAQPSSPDNKANQGERW